MHFSTIPRAFLSSLRANLQISFEELNASSSSSSSSLQPSPGSHGYGHGYVLPYSKDSSSSGFADDLEDPPSPTDTSTTSTTQQSFPLPTTWTYHASTDDDRRAALRLIADSIREQRMRSILLHPAVLAVALFLLTFFLVRCAFCGQEQKKKGLVVCLIATTSLVAAALTAAYRTTRNYLTMASAVEDTAWLRQGLFQQRRNHNNNYNHNHGSAGGSKHHYHNSMIRLEDEVLITKDHDEVVAVLVLRTARTNALTSGAPSANGMRALRHRHSNSSSISSSSTAGRWTGVIRAWTVKKSRRNRGLGLGLLESAVAICRVRRLDGPIFADDERFCSALVVSSRGWWWCRWWPFGGERLELRAKECLRAVIEGKK